VVLAARLAWAVLAVQVGAVDQERTARVPADGAVTVDLAAAVVRVAAEPADRRSASCLREASRPR
jgi:hypothetical protein